jgi:glycosyltransferase involved in cell wall biosynthesis
MELGYPKGAIVLAPTPAMVIVKAPGIALGDLSYQVNASGVLRPVDTALSDPRIHETKPASLDLRHLVVRPPDAHPNEANGVIGVARELVLEQRAAGERARLIMIAKSDAAAGSTGPVSDCDIPTQLVPLAGLAVAGRIVRLRRRLVESLLLNVDKTTVFHIHGGREPFLAGVALALRRRGIPYAVTIHGRFSHVYDVDGECREPRTALYLKLVERGMLQGARFVQALSSEESLILRRIAPRAHFEILGNGAYSARRDPLPTQAAARPPSASFPHFVYCGRYAIKHKGLDLLIEGFARFRKTGGSGRLTTIGTGPEREQLFHMTKRLGIADAVEVAGPMFGEARDMVLRSCDFFIMPSRFEGMPLAALEAALLGLPLIVTSGTGLRASVQALGAGIAIETSTADGVCAAMHRAAAIKTATLIEYATAAFAFATTFGDWTAIAGRLSRLYRSTYEDFLVPDR